VNERESVLGLEDSGAGVCAVRLAGLPTVGMAGGNVEESGGQPLCHHFCRSLGEVTALLG
jgi:beta-phosphoglucomutase-like phosphatase (HAD superfamily)